MPALSILTRPLVLTAAALISLNACGSDGGPLAPATVATVQVSPPAAELIVGDTLRLVATPRTADGVILLDRVVTWTSLDNTVATVNALGTVQALAAGSVEVSATVDGVTTDVEFLVRPVPAVAILVDHPTFALREGQQRQLTAVLLDALGRPLADERLIEWRSADANVATVDAQGMVRAITEGATSIIATHGALEATAVLKVGVEWTADMLFEAHDHTSTFPYLFVLDPRVSADEATKLMGFAGTRHAAPSPDGTRIAFTCDVAICVADRDGTNIDVLTDGDLFNEDSPSWSPDGQRIAFRRWAHGGSAEQVEQTDIWVINANGSGAVNLTADATSQSDPAWSPVRGDGGTRIAYRQMAMIDGFVTNRLYTMRPDGTDRRAETDAGLVNATEPSWTPDGARLVYVQDGGEVTSDIWVVTVGAGNAAPLMASPIPEDQRSPAVSPDGRHVLFTSTHEEVAGVGFKRQLFTVRVDGTGLKRRTSDALDKEHPAWRVPQ